MNTNGTNGTNGSISKARRSPVARVRVYRNGADFSIKAHDCWLVDHTEFVDGYYKQANRTYYVQAVFSPENRQWRAIEQTLCTL